MPCHTSDCTRTAQCQIMRALSSNPDFLYTASRTTNTTLKLPTPFTLATRPHNPPNPIDTVCRKMSPSPCIRSARLHHNLQGRYAGRGLPAVLALVLAQLFQSPLPLGESASIYCYNGFDLALFLGSEPKRGRVSGEGMLRRSQQQSPCWVLLFPQYRPCGG